MSETFYRKKGRRYIPVSEYDSELSHSFGEGHSLVYCKPGSKLTICNINPESAAVLACLAECRDQVADVVMNAAKKPHSAMDIVRALECAILERCKS